MKNILSFYIISFICGFWIGTSIVWATKTFLDGSWLFGIAWCYMFIISVVAFVANLFTLRN